MGIENPDELEHAEREIRISELKARARELAGEDMTVFESPDAPLDLLEEFWRSIVEMEGGDWTTGHQQLAEDGIELPSPELLSDTNLPGKLNQLLLGLARRQTYVYNTNHLSNRQLYECLWAEALNESFPTFPGADGMGGYIIDLVGSGSVQDTLTYLRYYATDQERLDWQQDCPEYELPPREQPPYGRDAFLPRPDESDLAEEDVIEPDPPALTDTRARRTPPSAG